MTKLICKVLIIVAVCLALAAPAVAHHQGNPNTAAGIIIGGIVGGLLGAELDEANRRHHERLHRDRPHRYGRRWHREQPRHHHPRHHHAPLTTTCREGWHYVTLLDGTLHEVWGVTCRDANGMWRVVR